MAVIAWCPPIRGSLRVAEVCCDGYARNAIVHSGRLDANLQLLSKPYTQQNLTRKLRERLDSPAVGTM
jgi:hypothetical protein